MPNAFHSSPLTTHPLPLTPHAAVKATASDMLSLYVVRNWKRTHDKDKGCCWEPSCSGSGWDSTYYFSAPRNASELRVTWAQNLQWTTVCLDIATLLLHSDRRDRQGEGK